MLTVILKKIAKAKNMQNFNSWFTYLLPQKRNYNSTPRFKSLRISSNIYLSQMLFMHGKKERIQ